MTRALPAIAALLLVLAPARAGDSVLETVRAELRPPDGRFERFPRWTAPSRPTVALALSGGGARGLAHIGVLEAMKEDGLEFDAVAGTSAGALFGGFLAAGYEPEEVESIVRNRRWNSIVAGLDLRTRVLSETEDVLRSSPLLTWRTGAEAPVRFGALVESSQLETEFYRYFFGAQRTCGGDFDRLRIRFRPVATDVRTGRKVAPGSGDLAALIRGSVAIPGVFAPIPYGDLLLSDGLLVENLPVETARSLGADLVIAVDVTEDVDPGVDVRGTLAALNRSVNILMLEQVERARGLADVLLRPDVGGASPGDFEKGLDALLEAGRSAYATKREAIRRRLDEAWEKGASPLFWDDVEAVPGDASLAEEFAGRLGRRGSATRLRLETELARMLNRGPWADGRIEIVDRDGVLVLRIVLERNPPLEIFARAGGATFGPKDPIPRLSVGEPFSWAGVEEAARRTRADLLNDGRILLGLEEIAWEPGTGTLTATITEPSFAGIEIVGIDGMPIPRLPRLFAGLEGKPFRFDAIAERLGEIEARGLIDGWRIEPAPGDGEGVTIVATVREDRHFEVEGSVAYRDALEWAGLLRLGFTNLSGRGDTVEAIGIAASDVAGGTLRYRSEYVGGFRNLGFETSFAFENRARPVVGADQTIVDDDAETYEASRLDVALVRRVTSGAVLRVGLADKRESFDAGSFGPEEVRERTEVHAAVDLERRDRLLFPSDGYAFRWEGRWSVAGDPYRSQSARFDLSGSFGRLRPVTLSLRLAGGVAEDAPRPAYWFDPGGFRDLYGFLPYALQAPRYRHGGGTMRFRFLDLGAIRSWVEVGADSVRFGYGDEAPGIAGDSVAGYGISVTALVRTLGPITVGWSRNSQDGTLAFLTLGYPFVRQ